MVLAQTYKKNYLRDATSQDLMNSAMNNNNIKDNTDELNIRQKIVDLIDFDIELS